jgi:aryl-alcohol dehydrogenase-like predicted oxidoreductase
MKYRTLGSTGLKTSVIGVGTWQFGGEWGKDFSQEEVNAMFRRAGELGINLVDTAECYGDHLSEALTGGAIAGQREKWIVATKFGHKFHGYMNRSEPRSPADVQKQLEDSLRSLRTDFIDLYQYHSWGDDQFLHDDVLAVLHAAKAAGKIRHIGNSVGRNDNVKQTAASQPRGIEVMQIVYNRLDRKPEETIFPVCIEQNLGVLARVPLASGFLSGKYRPGARFNEGDVRHGRRREQLDQALREVEQIQREEVPAGVDMAQWALAWCLQHPAVTCVIPGCKSVEQVESNAAAAELEMVRPDHPQAAR